MHRMIINEEKIRKLLTNTPNFKYPGTDGIPNFLAKAPPCSPHSLSLSIQQTHPRGTANGWMVQRKKHYFNPMIWRTHLPNKYRPITCLPATFKLWTGVITDAIYDHLTQGAFEVEQKGCKRGCYGTTDHLLWNKTILENCKLQQTNFCTAWKDYTKAFDSVAHAWIIKCIQEYKIDPK